VKTSPRGAVAFVLHAHLPWVRAALPGTLEERWFFEAMAEVYVPLWRLLQARAARGAPTPLTLSVSPTLGAMMADATLARRFRQWLAEVDAVIARGMGHLRADALRYAALERQRKAMRAVEAAWSPVGEGFVRALGSALDDAGAERWTTAYAHPYLPALLPRARWLAAHAVTEGLRAHGAQFGSAAKGLWLPECGWDPALDALLVGAGVRRTVLESHAVLGATPRPRFATARPVETPAGLGVLPRDPVTARAVWDRTVGYPGHPAYREYHRDLGALLPVSLAGPFGDGGGGWLPTGVKPFAITDRHGGAKAPYDAEAAEAQARRDAGDFVARCEAVVRLCAGRMAGARPVMVAAFDAELFGHWWAEGLVWLDAVLDGLAAAGLEAVTAADAASGPREVVTPAASSWGEGGHGSVWLTGEGAAMARAVEAAAELVAGLRDRAPEDVATRRATRELLGMAASDWAFMLHGGGMAHYARERFARHRAAVYDFARGARPARAARSAAEPEDPLDDPPFVDEAAAPTGPPSPQSTA